VSAAVERVREMRREQGLDQALRPEQVAALVGLLLPTRQERRRKAA
jgi:hypothetical protein